MVNFAIIPNAELAKLMEESMTFKSLPEERQVDHVAKIAKLSPAVHSKMVEFFKDENKKEKLRIQKAKLEYFKKLDDESEALLAKIKREMPKDRELKAKQCEQTQLENMISNI